MDLTNGRRMLAAYGKETFAVIVLNNEDIDLALHHLRYEDALPPDTELTEDEKKMALELIEDEEFDDLIHRVCRTAVRRVLDARTTPPTAE